MPIRNEIIDKSREDLINYIAEKEITAYEWTFVKNYIDQVFENKRNKVTLK